MAVTSWSNSSGIGISSNPYAVTNGMYDIPGLSDSINELRRNSIESFNRIEAQNKWHLENIVVPDVVAGVNDATQKASEMAKQQIADFNKAIDTTAFSTDNFIGSQVGALATSGLDSTVVSAFAAAAAKTNADQYNQTLAQTNKALALQQQFLDYAATPVQAGKGYDGLAELMAKDLNGEYATTISNRVGDLVSQLTDIQNNRQNLTTQTNTLLAAASLQNSTETAKVMMGIGKEEEVPEQQADIGVDVSPNQTNNTQSAAALDSRGGGRYVTTTSAGASGLRI